MRNLPHVVARYAPQPEGVAWPTDEWPRGTAARQRELDDAIDDLFRGELVVTNAVVIVQGGRVLVERYGGVREYFDRPSEPVSAATQLLSWSMAKSMLHLVVGTLVDEGRLDPHQLAPVPEWAEPTDPRHHIRLADLLAMRDGLDFVERYEPDEPSHVIDMLFGEGQSDVAAYAAARPLAHEPGTVFNYSSGTTNVLSRVVADVVGRGDAYRAFLQRRLFDPLGMRSGEATLDDAGVFIASSYVHATALDFAKFGLLYLRGGQWDAHQLVSREWTDTAQLPRSYDAEGDTFYGWQWWVTGDEHGTYWASGYEGQMITVVPALDALVLRFGHTPAEHYPRLHQWRQRVLELLAP